ncbi:MAG: glycosyltransferase family 39 protein [Bacteroidota bacterium]
MQSVKVSEVIIIFFAALAVYGFTLSRSIGTTHDSIEYINSIDAITARMLHQENQHVNSHAIKDWEMEVFHPHHLLYNPAAAGWVVLLRLSGITLDSVILVAFLNAIFGAAGVSVFYLLLRNRMQGSVFESAAGSLLVLACFGYWFHSVVIEVYIIPVFFLLLALYFLTHPKPNVKTFLAVGFFHGAAILFHQIHVLFFLPVLGIVLLQHRSRNITFLKSIAGYSAAIIPVVGIPYLYVVFGFLNFSSIQDIQYWTTRYASEGSAWSPFALTTFAKAAFGFCRSIVGGNFAFAIPEVQSLMKRLFADNNMEDEIYLVRHINIGFAYFLGFITITVFAWLFYLVFKNRKTIGTFRLKFTPVALAAFLWFLPYAAFFCFWVPQSPEFWFPQLLCVWIGLFGISVAAADTERRRNTLQILSIGLLLLFINYFGSMRFISSQENDYYYSKTYPVAKTLPSNSLFITGRSWIVEAYYERFSSDVQIIGLQKIYIEEKRDAGKLLLKTRNTIAEATAQGCAIYINYDAINPGKDVMDDPAHQQLLKDFWRSYTFECNDIGDTKICRIVK